MTVYVFQKYPEIFAFQLFQLFFFFFKTLRLDNLKTRTSMNAKTSVFVIYAEVTIYLL